MKKLLKNWHVYWYNLCKRDIIGDWQFRILPALTIWHTSIDNSFCISIGFLAWQVIFEYSKQKAVV